MGLTNFFKNVNWDEVRKNWKYDANGKLILPQVKKTGPSPNCSICGARLGTPHIVEKHRVQSQPTPKPTAPAPQPTSTPPKTLPPNFNLSNRIK